MFLIKCCDQNGENILFDHGTGKLKIHRSYGLNRVSGRVLGLLNPKP